jgi:hypothetical protein
MSRAAVPQPYPRIREPHKLAGFLDDSRLVQHRRKPGIEELKKIITAAVAYSHRKSSLALLNVAEGTPDGEIKKIFLKSGKELFDYFRDYCGDPAMTAYECLGRHYSQVAAEHFHNRTLQKQRMNSGWRYQRIAFDCAAASGRFKAVSDIGAKEADFNLIVETTAYPEPVVNIYVSVKNREDTIGGPDWPNAIIALETMAREDRNRSGPYLCVFGIAMERGTRKVKRIGRTTALRSVNTEIWFSDFFWPFVSNFSYEEIASAVLDVLMEQGLSAENRTIGIPPPPELIDAFGDFCRKEKLVDSNGKFHDARKLVNFFCTKAVPPKKRMSRLS